jgi:hypothetical protein
MISGILAITAHRTVLIPFCHNRNVLSTSSLNLKDFFLDSRKPYHETVLLTIHTNLDVSTSLTIIQNQVIISLFPMALMK